MLLLSSTAIAQTFDRVTSTGNVQSGVSVTAPVANANNASGFELMSGSATVDGAGGTFGNFDTVGGEGSGGGAGMGGVFFVNTGASLTIRNANFTNNTAKGGEGGGGGSVDLADAGFSVTDKTAVGTSNFIAGFQGTVGGTASGGGFQLNTLTYGANKPPYGVLTGATIAIESTGSPVFATVGTSDENGITFAGGLNVSSYVKSARVFGDLASAALGGGGVYADPADVVGGNVTRVNISLLSQTDRLSLQPGGAVVGTGIPPGVTVSSIVKDGDGEPIYAVFSAPIPQAQLSTAGFNIFSPPPLTGAAFTAGGNSVTFAEGALSPILEVGMTVTSPGFAPGTTITAIDPVTRTVTFSSPPPANLIKFDTAKPGSVVGSNVLFAPSANTGLVVGDPVSGAGIPAGTTVTAVNGDRIELSNPVTAKVSAVVSETLKVTGTTITSRGDVGEIRAGMVVQGNGVPANTRVVSVNTVDGTVTLSNGVTGDPSRLLFVSDTAFGGAMNGRAPVLTGTKGQNGNDGISAFNNAGEGGSGQGGTAGSNNASGTGGSGGDGGDGRDGQSTNPDLAFEASALALDIAAAIAEGIGAGVPDPYPKPVLAVAAGLSVAAKVVSAADVARRIVVFQTNVGQGLTGTGGDGGEGGDGGNGSAFYGGGVGGAGGDAGAAAGNSLGDGAAGAGGAGGNGGFGAGGGAAGKPGEGATSASIADGGRGGFGGGSGSGVNADGNTFGGIGGSGLGGAIFVRSGGTLVLQGGMTFSGNRAQGGSSGDEDGASGVGAGSDMFIMKGADVTIAPGAGQSIVFEGTIADNSAASGIGANATGDGASLKINGEGLVAFLNENTYTGDTVLQSGRLRAEDGVGVHEDSRIVFDGIATNDGSGALQLTGTNVPVFLSSGTFDRWVGDDSDNVMWTGSGGFAALAPGLTVNLGGSGAGNQSLVWGQNGFVPNGDSLVLGAIDATGVVTFQNNIGTANAATDDVAFYLVDNVASTADHSVLQGSVTADTMTVNANVGGATMKVEGDLTVATLDIRGGTVETRGTGRVADTATVAIASGATFVAGTVDTTGTVTNSGTYTVNAAQTVASLTNADGSTVNQNANLTTKTGGGVTNNTGSTYNLGGNITSATGVVQNGQMNVDGDRTITATTGLSGTTDGRIALIDADDKLTVDQAGNTTFAGVISGLGAVTKEGTGTLTITGANTYTGGTTVSEGTLDTTGGGTLADTGDIDIASGATFVAGTEDTVRDVTNAGTYDVNKDQTVASLTNADGGLVDQDADLFAGTGGVTNDEGGTYELSGNITSSGDVTQNGEMDIDGNLRIDVTGADTGLTGSGTITMDTATDALTVDQLGDTTFAGVISGLGDVTKEGTGTLTITGANTYTGGTTVSEGTLDTTGGGTLADTGDIDIASGATFVAGTVDTVRDVTNAGTYDVNKDQTVASLTNADGGLVDQDADLFAGTGGVTNDEGGTYELSGNITSSGDVTQNGEMDIDGNLRIDVTGADTGLTGSGTITMDTATDALTVDQLGDTTFAGVISGLGDVTKEGTGTLTITGANTYTGGTTVSEGTLDTTGGGTLADTGDIDIASGATFVAGTEDTVRDVTNAGTYDVNKDQTVASLTNADGGLVDQDADLFAGTGGVTNDEGGTYELSGNITSSGDVTQNGEMDIDGNLRIDVTGADTGLTGSGTITMDTATDALTVDQLGDTTFAGVISGLGDVTKEGTGTLTITGANTYTGGTTVSEGTLDTTGGGTLADTGDIDIASGATFVAGTVDTVRDVTNAGTYDVNKDQTVASLTNADGGLVDQDADLFAGTGGVTNDEGGTYELSGNITSSGDVTQNGEMDIDGNLRIDVTGADTGLTGSGTITMDTATDALTVDQLGDTTFAGVISGLGDVTKEGTGTLTITGANTYTGGTTVSEGTLDTTGGGTLADTGDIDIASGATFVAGTEDTVRDVTNAGTYDVNKDQTVASLTNADGGLVDQDADLFAGTGGVTNDEGGTYELSGNITSSGDVTQNGEMDIDGNLRIDVTGADTGLTGSGTITMDTATDALTVDQLGDTTFAGVISGLGDVTKEGTGTLTITGANTYTGGTTVSEGTLDTTGGGTLADTGDIDIASGATFVAGTEDTVRDVTNAGTYDVNKDQTVASLTNADGGLVDQDADLFAGTGGVTNDEGGTYELSGNITSSGDVTQNGEMDIDGNLRIDVTGADTGLTGSGTITMDTATDALTVDQLGDTTFAGVISGLGDVTKEGTGTLTITGANTYTGGTTVSEGTLDTTGGGTLADTGDIDILDGATFVAGTVDTVRDVTNAGTYDVDADQTVTSLTNADGGLVDQDADLFAGTGGVTNDEGGTYELSGNITSSGDVTQNGEMDIDGNLRIDVTGADTGLTGSGTITMDTATDALTVDQLGDTTFAGVISGLGDVTKEGTGTLTITGANTYTGGTTVSEGTLDTTGGGTLADTGDIDIASGATFVAGTVDTVRDVTNAGTYDVDADQTVTSLTNANGSTVNQDADLTTKAGGGVTNNLGSTYNLGGDIASATGVVQNGQMTVDGDRTITATTGLSGSGRISLTDATDALTVDQLGNTTFAGVVSGAGALSKDGTGTLTVTGANTFTGGTTVSAGTLSTTGGGTLADTGAIDIASGATFVAGTVDRVGDVTNAGTLDLATRQNVASLTNAAGGRVDQDADLTVRTGGVTNASGATFNQSADIAAAGTVTQNGTLNVDGDRTIATAGLTGTGTIRVTDATDALTLAQRGNTTFGGRVTGAGDLTKDGAGTLTLNGAAGAIAVTDITLAEGGLSLTRGGIIGSAADLTIDGGAFAIAQGSQTLRSLSGNGSVSLNGSNLTLSQASDFRGDITDAGALVVNGAFDFAGALSGATFDLVNGEIILAGASTATFDDVTLNGSDMVVAGPAAGQPARLQVSDTLSVTGCSVLELNGAPVADRPTITAGQVNVTGACAVLSGTGYVDSPSTIISGGGTLNPGQSPGVIVFSGDLTLADSTTIMEIAGAAPGTGHDYVNIGGRFTIGEDATLNVKLIDGYVPGTGQAFNLFDFDPEQWTGEFDTIVNETGRNYVYAASTGVLVTLGAADGDDEEQVVDLSDNLGDFGSGTNDDASEVIEDFLSAGGSNGVGGAFGGNLIPALAAADPEERAAIFARFTSEGYGGVYEYAYRSLGFGGSWVDRVDIPSGPRTFADVRYMNQDIGSKDSQTLSDFDLNYGGLALTAGVQLERLAFGIEFETLDGSANVGSVLRADGSGRNLEFGVVGLVNETETSRLQAYATVEDGSHTLDGRRTAILSTTRFEDVDSDARVYRLGAQYVTTVGRTTYGIDGSIMRGTLGAMDLTERGGDLNDRLTLRVPETDVTGLSLALTASSAVTQSLSLNGGLSVDVTNGLNDYAILTSVGNETRTVGINVPGIDRVVTTLSIGAEYALSPQARLAASGYVNGIGNGWDDKGAEIELKFDF